MPRLPAGIACAHAEHSQAPACTFVPDDAHAAFLKTARMGPVFVEGQVYGQSVLALDPHSPLAQAGLQAGDTIRAIDGVPTTSPEGPRYLWCRLARGDAATLDVVRKGESMRVELGPRS